MGKDLLLKSVRFLEEFVTDNRLELINSNLKNRTQYITIVLENIFQPQNASAVMRSCDCFGIQDLHVIENSNEYQLNPEVVMGSSKWVDLYQYNQKEENTLDAILSLKQKGYRIVATSPHVNDVLLPDFDLQKGKAAFFFGTELTGVSDIVLEHADEFVKIPMYGFTESFNISVSAALVMSYLTTGLRRTNVAWHLNDIELLKIKLDWLKKSVRKGDKILNEYLKKESTGD